MEVVLLEASGLPDGCLFSMRGGPARRAAAVSCRQQATLRLPRGLPPDSQVSLDFLAPVGSAVLQLQPGVEQCPVEWSSQGSAGSPATVKFQVREDLKAATLTGSPPCSARGDATPKVGQGHGAKRHLGMLEEQGYLEKHGLLTWVQELLQCLLKDRPDDPWGYIGERSSAHARQIRTDSAETQDASTSAWTGTAETAAPPLGTHSEVQERMVRSPDLVEARQRLRGALGEAASEGRLAQFFPRRGGSEAAGDDLAKGQCAAVATSTDAASSSSSARVWSQNDSAREQAANVGDLRARLRGALVGSIADGRLQQAVQAQEEDDRLRLRNLLSAAVNSGRLQQVLQASCSEPCVSQSPTKAGMMRLPPQSTWALAYAAPPASHDKLQDARGRLRSLLSGAARSGNLSRSLGALEAGRSHSKPSSPRMETSESAHAEAPKMRLPPASTWELAYTSPPSNRWRPTLPYANADLRAHLRNTFARATRDGRLERILEEGPEADEEAEEEQQEEEEAEVEEPVKEGESLRARVRDVLSKAVFEGKLDTDTQDPRERVRTLLSQSATNGQLQKVMEEAQGSKPAATGHLAEAKAQLRDLLSTAAADGRLEGLFSKEPTLTSSSHQEDLRRDAASLLSGAAKSGRLVEVLGRRHQEQQSPGRSLGEGLRRDAASLLSGASTSGRLVEVLAAQRQQAREEAVVQARAAARNILLDAAAGEQLEKALRQVRQEAGQEETQHQPPPAQPPAQQELLDRLRSVLVRSAVDGQLAEALAADAAEVPAPSTVAKPIELRSLCARVRGLLVGAVQTGQLAGVLAQELPTKAKSPETVPDQVAAQHCLALPWCHLPSTGTWVARAPATPPTRLAAPAQQPAEVAAPVAAHKEQTKVAWHLRPSTGTWLAPVPRRTSTSPSPEKAAAAPAATAIQRSRVPRPAAISAARMPGLRELVEEQFEGACEHVWSAIAVPQALRGFTPEAELVFEEEDGLCLPGQDCAVPHLPDLTSAAAGEGGSGPPSPTHSESSSVALLRELLDEDKAATPAETHESLELGPGPVQLTEEPSTAVQTPQLHQPQQQQRPTPLLTEPRAQLAEVAPKAAEGKTRRLEGLSKSSTPLLGVSRPAGSPAIRRPSPGGQNPQKMEKATWGSDLQKGGWKDPALRGRLGDTGERLLAARAAGVIQDAGGSTTWQVQPDQEEVRPNTAMRRQEAAREVLKDIAGLGDSAAAAAETSGTVTQRPRLLENSALSQPQANTAAALADLGTAGPSKLAGHPREAHVQVSKGGRPGSGLVAGLKRLTSRSGTLQSSLAPLSQHGSATGGGGSSGRAGDQSLPEQPLAGPRFRERDPLWLETGPARVRREHAEASVSCSEDEKLRTNLGKLLSFRRKGQISAQ